MKGEVFFLAQELLFCLLFLIRRGGEKITKNLFMIFYSKSEFIKKESYNSKSKSRGGSTLFPEPFLYKKH